MDKAYDKAIKLLKIRPHHSEELTRKLMMRGFSRDDISAVIQKLADKKLIDNESFAQIYLDELLRNKTFGFYGFKAKLMQRGVSSDEADNVLKEKLSVEDEIRIAEKIVEREGGSGKREDKVKLAQKLSRKGFRTEVIQRILNNPSVLGY